MLQRLFRWVDGSATAVDRELSLRLKELRAEMMQCFYAGAGMLASVSCLATVATLTCCPSLGLDIVSVGYRRGGYLAKLKSRMFVPRWSPLGHRQLVMDMERDRASGLATPTAAASGIQICVTAFSGGKCTIRRGACLIKSGSNPLGWLSVFVMSLKIVSGF